MEYGLALEGGGSKGSYHIGACKALKEMGAEFSCVAGTSVGALNGALIVQDDIDKAYKLWHDISLSKVIDFSDGEYKSVEQSKKDGESVYGTMKKLRLAIKDRGLNIDPLVKMVDDNLDEDKIRKSKTDFGLVTIDLSNRKVLELYKEDIPQGKMAGYLLASASLPGFKLRNLDGKVFIDGGLYNSLPIDMVIKKGCKDIVVIRTFGHGRIKKTDTTGVNIIEISPNENLGPILDFSSKVARKNLKMGYFDAIKAMKKMKGTRYYIESVNDETLFLNYFLRMSDEKIKKLAKLVGVEEASGKRALLELIIPKIADLAGIPKESSYEDICISVIEMMAEASNVERFKIYKLSEVIDEIVKGFRNTETVNKNEIPRFMLKADFFSRFIKNKILGSLAYELSEDLSSLNLQKSI